MGTCRTLPLLGTWAPLHKCLILYSVPLPLPAGSPSRESAPQNMELGGVSWAGDTEKVRKQSSGTSGDLLPSQGPLDGWEAE